MSIPKSWQKIFARSYKERTAEYSTDWLDTKVYYRELLTKLGSCDKIEITMTVWNGADGHYTIGRYCQPHPSAILHTYWNLVDNAEGSTSGLVIKAKVNYRPEN